MKRSLLSVKEVAVPIGEGRFPADESDGPSGLIWSRSVRPCRRKE